MPTVIMRCRNHPTYRWTKTKHGPGYIGAGVLMFDGEEGGKPSNPLFNVSESTLAQQPQAYQDHYREAYTPECDCPFSDLEVIAEVDESAPRMMTPKEHIEQITERNLEALRNEHKGRTP